MKILINYVFLLIFSVAFSQNKITLSQALNITSKQSMLSARLAKAKIFKATNPSNTNVKQKLGVSLIQFEQNLSILREIDLPKEVHLKVSTVEMLWTGYKKNILNNDRAAVKKTIDFNNVIISYLKDVFKDILLISKASEEYPYNSKLAGFPAAYTASNNLKYLSQTLALYYNAYYSKLLEYDVTVFNDIISDIDKSIDDVQKLNVTSDIQIESKTKDLLSKWMVLKEKIHLVTQNYFVTTTDSHKPEFIFNESDALLKEADLLIRLYKAHNIIN